MKRIIAVALMSGGVLTGAVAANAFTGPGAQGAGAASTVVKVKGDGPRHGRHGHRGPRGPRGQMMRELARQADANGDGAISQEEIDIFIQTTVDGGDANGDGNVSLEEFKVIWLQLMDRQVVDRFQSLDQDGDGQITAEERAERFGGIVVKLDRNGDGALSRDDMRFGKGRGGPRGGHGPRHERSGFNPSMGKDGPPVQPSND